MQSSEMIRSNGHKFFSHFLLSCLFCIFCDMFPCTRLYSERLEQLPHALPAMVEALLHLTQAEPLVVITGGAECHPLLRHVHTHHLPSHDIISVSPLTSPRHPALAGSDLESRQGAYLLQDNGTLSEFVDSVEQLVEIIDKYAKK